ncbi:SAM-dependent methyltransferase [Trichlorobacter lovleyi]|uniref:SAM-dependent methyltransferase n=1 Tax=Trichlorobacter lovleyi TaxID=313985 RepID=UPI00223ED75F|nr:class I SAM-dependent methyltransferase [Trichlorobacter lovleyi]
MIGQVKTDQKAIAGHYTYDKDFFLRLMDASRCYSQAVYERDDETREAAQRRKLDYALAACMARAGDQTLDVGGGWGTFSGHAGTAGMRVTSLTVMTTRRAGGLRKAPKRG